ncbi:hypothetical protein [Actinoplanes sp. NPDC049802]|uniref:hypothetical protein n=1 Tax=Actinoplanes sp. NPDC049802 TaxID=3154742 RepID=UPI00340E88BD
MTTTGPMPGWTSRQEFSPYRGLPVKTVDVNGRVTAEVAYDPLDRTAEVWRLGWRRAGYEDRPNDECSYHFAPDSEQVDPGAAAHPTRRPEGCLPLFPVHGPE